MKGQAINYKFIYKVTDRSANWDESTKDCVAIAKAQCGRLLELEIVRQTEKTKDTRNHVEPHLLRQTDFPSLSRIEQQRLHALVIEDVERYPKTDQLACFLWSYYSWRE